MNIKPHLAADFYKYGHIEQYPEGTTCLFDNMTFRNSKYFNGTDDYDNKVLNFGLQKVIKEYLIGIWNENFFQKPKEEVLNDIKKIIPVALNISGDKIINAFKELHELGYLPISIRAREEGTRTPINEPVLTIMNTHPKFFWLVGYLETALSSELWRLYTNSTVVFEFRKTMEKYFDLTGADTSMIKFQCHDFSARGLHTIEDQRNQISFLTCFMGTDTVQAIQCAMDNYNTDYSQEIVGASVPATEHSVMCAGTKEKELETYKRLINEIYPNGIVAIVSDTWDYWKVITEYLPILKDDIMKREFNGMLPGKVVIRPDSGIPERVIAGYRVKKMTYNNDHTLQENINNFNNAISSYYEAVKFNINNEDKYYDRNGQEVPIHEIKGTVECLWDIFGGTKNRKNFKELDSHIGMIYGDSITLERMTEILERLMSKGFAANNCVQAVGGYTQCGQLSRDTLSEAIKATYIEVNGEGRNIFKDPKTDSGKKSHKGLMGVFLNEDGEHILKQEITMDELYSEENLMKEVFLNGKLLIEHSLKDIRARIDNEFI